MDGTNGNYESPEVAYHLESPTSATKHTGDQFQDSGFFEADDQTAYEYVGDNDFILYPDGEDESREDGEDPFDDEYAVDIASTKANHGSVYIRNSTTSKPYSQSQESSQSAVQYEGQDEIEDVVVVDDEEGDEERPRHRFSTPINTTTEKGFSPLDDWAMFFHRHESIAYRFEQPPNPTHVFQTLQNSWGYEVDIDLS